MQTVFGGRAAGPGQRLGMTSWGAAAVIPEPAEPQRQERERPAMSAADELSAKFNAAARGAKEFVGGIELGHAEVDQYIDGLNALGKQAGKSGEQILEMGLDRKYVMQVGREAHQDQMRDLREEDEARRAHADFQKTAKEAALTGAKAEFARAGPQAVTAPPAALFAQYTSSIKGSMDQVKTSVDTGIGKLVDKMIEAARIYNRIDEHGANLLQMLSGGT